MKAVSVLEHFSDHGSIHQKLKKNTASVRSYPNSAGDGGLFRQDIINEALSSSGISETSISLGYHLGKKARSSRHSAKSHSSSSGDSRRRHAKHKSRHSKCSNRGEVEAKDEMKLPQGVELFKYGILKRFMDKYIKHGSKVGIKLDADTLRFTCKLFSDIMIYHIK
ncbi:hypothetical protein TNCV_3570831 [Trichonephila clavipes]|nr:hypothetical protein TNCV_3570831 [Trichonephila clavipes]